MEFVSFILTLVGLFSFIAFCSIGCWLMVDKHLDNKYKRLHVCENCKYCKGIAHDGYVACEKCNHTKEPQYCFHWEQKK